MQIKRETGFTLQEILFEVNIVFAFVRFYSRSLQNSLTDLLGQVILPVESLDIEQAQVLVHHVITVCLSEVNLTDFLQNKVLALTLEAHDAEDDCVAGSIIPTRLLIRVDFIWDRTCVDKHSSIVFKDEAL